MDFSTTQRKQKSMVELEPGEQLAVWPLYSRHHLHSAYLFSFPHAMSYSHAPVFTRIYTDVIG